MDIRALLLERFAATVETWDNWQPQDNISRQVWQDAVEQLALLIRQEFGQPGFELTKSEISIHYHKPLREFAGLISQKTGVAVERSQNTKRMNGGQMD